MNAPPVVPPASSGAPRPFWSVMIPTYNCARFLGETLRSVLAQDPGPEQMQIAVVDDHSTADDPQAVVREVAGQRVEFYRNPRSLGAPGNFNQCIAHARGQWIHILHGDDAVRPGFYQRLAEAAKAGPNVGAAFCRTIVMDEDGNWLEIQELLDKKPGLLHKLLPTLAVRNVIATPGIVVAAFVYSRIGRFNPALVHSADWDMWKRIATTFSVWYEPTPLALWRQHAHQDTARLAKLAGDLADIRKAIILSRSYLPQSQCGAWLAASRRFYAFYGLRQAQERFRRGFWRSGLHYLIEALKTSTHPAVLLRVPLALLRGLAGKRGTPWP